MKIREKNAVAFLLMNKYVEIVGLVSDNFENRIFVTVLL
jgi:hypothetical protein